MQRTSKPLTRRRFIAGAAGGLALSAAPASAQMNPLDPLVWVVTSGAPIRKGRVTLELPQLAENGNSVAINVRVDSPMTATDYVKSIHLFSEINPQRDMARFHLGPRARRAQVSSRVRLAGSQRVVAIAALSDGTFWSGSAGVAVTVPRAWKKARHGRENPDPGGREARRNY